MDKKQKQIEEMQNALNKYFDDTPMELTFTDDNGKEEIIDCKPFLETLNRIIREALIPAFSTAFYDAGYRKTFTSSLASNEQAAFKEGYRKGQKEAIKGLIDEWENNNELYIDFGHFLDELKEFCEVLK